VSELAIEHLDEAGAPCTRHGGASTENLLQLAMIGSRAPAFHHDCASKLQGLVMALDELTELTENGDPDLIRAIEAASDASRELNALLNINRALTKPAARTPIALATLLSSAAQRVAVALQGTLPDAVVHVTVPAMTHALALALDVAAGTGRSRSLAVAATAGVGAIDVALHAAPAQPSNASESIAIATFVVARDGGRLWCASAGDRLFVRLPTA
jgi:ABC-type transporter Mla subunit MlaD